MTFFFHTTMMCLVKNFNRILSESRLIKRNFSNKLLYSDEVILAKNNSVPIVALESTIITHGMPYPDNFDTAIRLENIVRQRVIFYFYCYIKESKGESKLIFKFFTLGCLSSYNWNN